jgi:enoyl-CoA hydratase/carnithine racemase
MSTELNNLRARLGGFVRRPAFEEYAEKYSDHFVMERRDGIIQLRMHTGGGPALFGFGTHNAWGQAWQEVGNDPENEVLILTGTGDQWLGADPASYAEPSHKWPEGFAYEHTYYDAMKLLENLTFAIDIPTIAAINGPSVAHTEIALLCDITLCTEESTIIDPHFLMGVTPGDGQQLSFQELLGTKRAAYYLYTGEQIDARKALELGLVNEVLPTERLLPRAWEIAEMIMKRPRATRRLTHAIIQRPWKRRLVQDLGFGVAHEMFGISTDTSAEKESNS